MILSKKNKFFQICTIISISLNPRSYHSTLNNHLRLKKFQQIDHQENTKNCPHEEGSTDERLVYIYIYIWRDIVAGGNERKRSVCSRERKLDDRSGALEINKRHRGLGGRMRVRWKLVVAGNRINLHKSRSFFARFPHRLLLHHFETRKEEVLVNMAYQIVRPSGIRSFIFFLFLFCLRFIF